MTPTISMSDLYHKLSQLGIEPNYIRECALPSWWNEELETKPVAVLEGAGYIAKRLGLDLKSLLAKDEPPRFKPQPHTKFKQHLSPNHRTLVAHSLVHRLAEMVAYGTEATFTNIPADVNQIRSQILTKSEEALPWNGRVSLTLSPQIDLTALLDYCWQQGIAVLHFSHFPPHTRPIEGTIQWHRNRPVIIIGAHHQDSAKLAFILAHELGHLALGHLTEGMLVEENIDLDSPDEAEYCANQFAINLGLDKSDISAKEPSCLHPNGQQIINKYLADRLDWDRFDDDSYEYLEKVLGVELCQSVGIV
ncbi:ImmA/IrrE family metallo-endopeptidase [Merismopedia glauca]|uniref:IrrE N-terminal-like domain-containing protein n=1 Tax=Merismopedia glauca CCAP 1448/3 TaxID=1296344 RepID=A0A2T1BZU0_9CYAN|nr:ImmA/IrrE family metallo-endopeptidase [Merismopedia glauca]PSB01539.1 hypothetical protein C7B64_17720 [Merismopedia glauca CCAP 1448/3]